jgi:undecaprenyl-diphosphatase
MEIIKTIILGVVEGLTEFIPVSSTAHLLIVEQLLGISSTSFWQAFTVCIQSGAILAAIWYFWDVVWSHLSLILKIVVGFIPTGIVGIALYPLIKEALSNNTIIGLALVIGGILLVTLHPMEEKSLEKIETVTYKQAFLIGVAQVFSVIPGVSRSGSTLIGGTWLDIPRSTIVTFSFLLGIPTIIGAGVVEMRHITGITHHEWMLILVGSAVAFVVALATIRFFINLLTKKPLAWFGWYRIAIGVLALLLLK